LYSSIFNIILVSDVKEENRFFEKDRGEFESVGASSQASHPRQGLTDIISQPPHFRKDIPDMWQNWLLNEH